MRTFFQYWAARFGLWSPEVGAVYRPDRDETPNPFKPEQKPTRVKVVAVQDGFVQFAFTDIPDLKNSTTVRGFSSYYLKVKP